MLSEIVANGPTVWYFTTPTMTQNYVASVPVLHLSSLDQSNTNLPFMLAYLDDPRGFDLPRRGIDITLTLGMTGSAFVHPVRDGGNPRQKPDWICMVPV